MPVTAIIKFTQGLLDPPAGEALIGALGAPVTASNGDNGSVKRWEWEWRATPAGSAILPGIVASGLTPTITFTPDVTGTYVLLERTYDQFGNVDEDERCFSVLEVPSGRLIPNFEASAASMNFNGQAFGWAPYLEAWLKAIDQAGSKLNIREEGVSIGDFAKMNFTGSGVTATDAGGGVVDIDVPIGAAEVLAAAAATLAAAKQETLIPLLAAQQAWGSATWLRVGAVKIDLSRYPTSTGGLTRKIRFVIDAQMTSGATTVEAQLLDVDHNTQVSSLTSSSTSIAEVTSGVLTEGSSNGNMRTDAATRYEVDLRMNGGVASVDQVSITSAYLRITYE